MMKHSIVVVVFFFFLSQGVFSQVNVEWLRPSKGNGVFQNIGLSTQLSSGNSDYFDLSVQYRIDWVLEKQERFLLTNLNRKTNGSDILSYKGFTHLRLTHYVRPDFGVEVFTQQEFNELANLENRILLGSGIRKKVANIGFGVQSAIGVGLMYELEDTKTKGENDAIKSTNYVSFSKQIGPSAKASGITYFQFALDDAENFRSLTQVSTQYQFNRNWSFFINGTADYDNQPDTGIEKFDLTLTQGLQISF